jgi:hypothetical protein
MRDEDGRLVAEIAHLFKVSEQPCGGPRLQVPQGGCVY